MHYKTDDGREILDGISGLWCCNAGHCHPKIVSAVQHQVGELDYATAFNMSHPKAFEGKNRVAARVVWEQVNILCDMYPDNLSYQAQKASEIMQNGDHEEAVRLYDKILLKNPINFSIHTSKGHAQKTLGKTDNAIESYKSAFACDPVSAFGGVVSCNFKVTKLIALELSKIFLSSLSPLLVS